MTQSGLNLGLSLRLSCRSIWLLVRELRRDTETGEDARVEWHILDLLGDLVGRRRLLSCTNGSSMHILSNQLNLVALAVLRADAWFVLAKETGFLLLLTPLK